ncbi:MAG: BREX-1 system adenine-specific DNA-methyltransferase PglX [Clostridia bacterium]|nr:BREX-1 system adenine-specific DNA-methyltransferase PglX [Clostridia bacterium]
MNKTSIKNFAVSARRLLLTAVERKAFEFGVTGKGDDRYDLVSFAGRIFTENEQEQRRELLDRIKSNGFECVIEEVAYTWFNRFIALRFMEVNGYLPSKVRVFSDAEGRFIPEIMKEAAFVDISGIDREKVLSMIDEQQNEELYKYLIIAQCNELSCGLPYMFEKIYNWTELLFPNNLLRSDSVIALMINSIPEEDWTDQVELLGWLYQSYITEKHEEAIDPLRGSIVKKEDVPAATQLFTTDWVVRYILDNSLGRYWMERCPGSRLYEKLGFYIRSEKDDLRETSEVPKPEEIKVLDPCVGSGHFLSYAFDILLEIYRECGWTDRDAARSIIQNNLYGLDIDDRTVQLARFSLAMKARRYNRRILNDLILINIVSIEESDRLTAEMIETVVPNDENIRKTIYDLKNAYINAREFGSLIYAPETDLKALKDGLEDIPYTDLLYSKDAYSIIAPLVRQTEILGRKYDVVATNPPYLNRYSRELRQFINDNFADYKGDLFSVFMYRNFAFCKENGYSGFMTPNVWMFIKTYVKLRKFILENKSISSLIQLAKGSFFKEATVDICAFVLRNGESREKGTYFRLEDFKGGMDLQREKVLEAISDKSCSYRYEVSSAELAGIPDCPIAYFLPDTGIFDKDRLGNHIDARIGMVSGDNERFLRVWFEVAFDNIEFNALPGIDPMEKKWYPLQKGGEFRLWYGNDHYVINWKNDGYELKNDNYKGDRVRSHNYNGEQQFKEGITWNSISSSRFHCRYSPQGFTYDAAGPLCEIKERENLYYILAFLSSKTADYFFGIINPTINFPSGYLSALPFVISDFKKVTGLSKECVELSKDDWDSFEISKEFRRHPLV